MFRLFAVRGNIVTKSIDISSHLPSATGRGLSNPFCLAYGFLLLALQACADEGYTNSTITVPPLPLRLSTVQMTFRSHCVGLTA